MRHRADRYRDIVTGWLSPRGRDGGIDEIPLPDGTPGRLWLCGKHRIGPDHHSVLDEVGATTVVCLVQEHELRDRYPDYLQFVRNGGDARWVAEWFPVHDLHAPPVEAARAFVGSLVQRLQRGETVVMHCAAGIGRAGTMAVLVLMELGLDLADAAEVVRSNRPMAGPEGAGQRALVTGWRD